MATPAFRPGETCNLQNPAWKTEPPYPSSSKHIASSRRVPSSRRMDFCRLLPPLKGRGTSNVALQAICTTMIRRRYHNLVLQER